MLVLGVASLLLNPPAKNLRINWSEEDSASTY